MTAKLLALDVLMRRIATMDYLVADGASPPPPPPPPPAAPFNYGLRFTRFLANNENVAPARVVVGEPVVARNAFFSQLIGPSVETCEGLVLIDPETDDNTQNPALTFGAITSTATNMKVNVDVELGRMNTTSGGAQFIEGFNSDAMIFVFSAPVFAFGCYMTDVGDFLSELMMIVKFTDSTEHVLRWAAPFQSNYSVTFAGFITPDLGVDEVRVINFGGVKSTPEIVDVFGYDDIAVATAAQVVTGGLTSYPLVWDAIYPYEWRHWVRFDELATGWPNRFQDAGDYDVYPIDSVADSVAAGTFQPTGPYAGHGSYRIVSGSRVTGAALTVTGNSLTVRGWIRRTGASVGTGRFFTAGAAVRLFVNGSNKLVVEVATKNLSTPVTATVTSTAALALNTWTHFMACAVRVYVPGVSNEIRLVIYLGSAMDADTSNTYSDLFGYDETYNFWVFGGSALVVIGGTDSSNYANADLADIAVGPVLAADIPNPIVVPTAPPWRTF